MLPLTTADSIKSCLVQLSNALPANWERVLVYVEFLRPSRDDEVESVAVAEYVVNGELVRDFQLPIDAHVSLRELYLAYEAAGESWAGLRIEASRDGEYLSKFYHEGYPLMDGDMEEIDTRMNG